MVLVRYVFQAKWGKANEVVANLKEMQKLVGEPYGQSRLFTDLSGSFHTVVHEIELESLAEWERGRAGFFSRPEIQAMVARVGELVEAGRTEFYTIEA